MSNFNVIKLDAIPSTNDWLKDLSMQGKAVDGDVVWVLNQTHGRGQRENVWQSQAGKSLTMSVFKCHNAFDAKQSFMINCAVSLAICHTLKNHYHLDVKVKWPNDILSAGKKIGGLLIENIIVGNRIKASVVGVGINVNQDKFENLPKASSLFLQTGCGTEITTLLEQTLDVLGLYFDRLDQKNPMLMLSEFEQCLFRKDEVSVFFDGEKEFEAIIRGVTAQGWLRLEQSSGTMVEWVSGSLQMRY